MRRCHSFSSCSRIRDGVRAAAQRVELSVELASEATVRWRCLGALFLAGGALALLAAAVPSAASEHHLLVIAIGAAATLAGAAFWRTAPSLSTKLMSPALALGTLLITLAALASGQPNGGFSLLYVWVALQSSYFLAPRSAVAHLVGVGLAYAAVLVALDGGADQWLLVLGTATVNGWLVAALRARIDRLAVHARRDPLTGLANRRAFDEALERALTAASVDGRTVAVAVVDLDRFKRLNDRHGHQSGDDALRRFATLAHRVCPSAVFARLGGDEFAIIAADADELTATELGQSVCGAVTADFELRRLGVSASVGVACFPEHGATPKELMLAADRAVYRAKDGGGDRCVQFTPEMLETVQQDVRRATGRAQLQSVVLLAETLDLRDASTAKHSQRVARYAAAIADELGLSRERCERVRLAGIVHDLGKIGVPDAVLLKPGPLDDDEWCQLRRHPEIGAQILTNADLHDLAVWVHAHHERPDGRGYPLGLRLHDIPIEARILAVADSYEAMLAERPYKTPMAPTAAKAELLAQRGTQFDEDVVTAFLMTLEVGATDRIAA